MNTLHLGTIGAAVGGAGMLAASTLSLPSAAANVAKTVSNAEKNQSTVTNYMDNQNNSNYAKHNRTNMDNAWNYFNPSNYQTSGASSNTSSSAASSDVDPGGPISTDSGTGSSSTTGTTTTGTMPQVPSPIRHILMGDVTHVLHQIKVHWRSNDTNPNWMPSAANWQADWSNWNPVLWEQNGSTYGNWANQLGTYLSSRFPGFATQIKEVGL